MKLRYTGSNVRRNPKRRQAKKVVPKSIIKPASENSIAFWSAVARRRARECVFIQFGRCCFRCGSNDHCQIDHHKPLSFGYSLEYGNAVCLCMQCNMAKSNLWPEEFYTIEELKRLYPYLDEQRTWTMT